jgi:hypothetical protein
MNRFLFSLLAIVTLFADVTYGVGTLGIASIDSFVPAPVDITTSEQSVALNLTMTDPNGRFMIGYVNLFDVQDRAVSSTFFNSSFGQGNQYSIPLRIPRYGSPGKWRVSFDLFDRSLNYSQISGTINTPEDDKFLVINTGAVDSTPPAVSAILIVPQTVDTSSSAQTIYVTVDLSDDLSRIQSAKVDFIDSAGGFITSLSKAVIGTDIVTGSFTIAQTLPQGSVTGVWRVEVTVRDELGNARRYGIGTDTSAFPEPTDAQFTIGPVTDSSFAKFAKTYSLTGNDALLGANPDNDWASNALEFLFGLNPQLPTAPNPNLYRVTRVANELWLDLQPAANLTITSNGNFLRVTNAAGDPPIRFTGQTATDLAGPWTNTRPVLVVGGLYRIILPISPGTNGFVRLAFFDP